jgi:PII-like signaling protein
MRRVQPAKVLRIHLSESDRSGGTPLYDAIVAKCRELKIAGASVFEGLEGFGEACLASRDRQLVIHVVDTPENIDRLIPVVAEMMDTGLISVSTAQMTRVEARTC